MASYKTAPLLDYDVAFQDVAGRLFDLASAGVPAGVAFAEKGSYSFRAAKDSSETLVKILIFQRAFGVQMQGILPWRDDGVYVLVRTNGKFGDRLWNDVTIMGPRFRDRMNRGETVGTAPNFEAQFAYFPVMAGEQLDAIADFISFLLNESRLVLCITPAK